MDPLGIAASIAGLLALASQVIETCDTLYTTIKRRPKIFKALSEDLKSLTRVLSDLAKIDASKATGEEDAFKECVDGCVEVLKELQSEFDTLQTLFKGNVMVKTYAQITFKSKMDSILDSRGQVERYTHTLSLALLVRQHASSAIIVARVNQIHGELSQAKTQARRPTKWLNPMQQYVEASASVVPMKNSGLSSLNGTASSSTLVDEDAPQKGTVSTTSQADSDAITSYGTFTEWLESFMQPDAHQCHSPAQDEGGTGTDVIFSASSKELSDSRRSVEINVTGLPTAGGADSLASAVTLRLEQSEFWDQALILLKQKGYRGICGFKLGDVLIGPLKAHSAEVRLAVTKGPSVYSMAKGLEINVDEPLELYTDNFVRVGETGNSIPPLSLNYSSDEGKIVIVDYPGNQPCKNLEITFNRTLRVPENGTVYNPPALFSPFPLINVEELKPEFLPQLRRKGGFLIPSFQREALAISFDTRYEFSANFAIRIYAGSVNTVTGETYQQAEVGAQDYVVVPDQNRLDGFLVRAGIVKQFVSMPLGSGYTAEGQVTGQETLGGLQMLIAPRFRARGTFTGYSNQRLTPQEAGLSLGNHLLMSGIAVESRAKEFRLAGADNWSTDDGAIFHRFTQCRPAFVHEILAQFSAPVMLKEPLWVQPVLPYKIEVQIRKPEDYVPTAYNPGKNTYLRSTLCNAVRLPREYSPFLGVNDFANLTAKLLAVTEVVVFFGDGRELQRPPTYVALHEIIEDGTVLKCQGYTLLHMDTFGISPRPETQDQPKEKLQWEMGVVPGGEIKQAIVPDPIPLEWNWKRARFVNIQILNSVSFEALTDICPPPPPIAYKDYIHARLPFFQTIESESVAEKSMLRRIKSVGEQDRSIDVFFQVNMHQDHKVLGCVICEENLADSILKPCNHVFCGLCIRDSMHEGDIIRCAACRKPANTSVSFAAPMELPSVPTRSVESDGGKALHVRDLAGEEALSKAVGKALGSSVREALRGGIDAQMKSQTPLLDSHGTTQSIVYESGRTAMQIAASSGQSDLVSRLIRAGIDVNEAPCGVDGRSALQAAAEAGHYNVVTQLLSAGANPNGPVSPVKGCSALEAAAANNQLAIVAQLLAHGAMTASSPHRKSALHIAAGNGNDAIVALLLAYGCDLDATVWLSERGLEDDESLGRCRRRVYDVGPSFLAAENGHLSVLKLLRRHGAKEKAADAACANGHLDVVLWFLDCEAEREPTQTRDPPGDLEDHYLDDETANDLYDPHFARMQMRVDEYGYKYRDGTEGLLDNLVHTAVEHGELRILRMLVSRGACLRVPKPRASQHEKCEKGHYRSTTILHKAAKSGFTEVVEYLLSAGFDVDENRVPREWTPLMEAARGGKEKVFRFLVDRGANIRTQDEDRQSIIVAAAKGGSIEIMTMLIDLGVDPTATSMDLISPLSTALEHKKRALADLLLDKLATVNDDLGRCYGGALRTAACHGYVGIVRELLKRGADANFSHPKAPSTALSWLGRRADAETSEADCLACARALVAARGQLRDLDSVLTHLAWQEKPALAAFLLENCLDESNTSDVDWSRHIETAVENSQSHLVKLLVSQFCLSERSEQDSLVFWDSVERAADAGQFEIMDILLQASSPEDANDYARATISSLGLGREDHMRQYLEERYVIEFGPVRKSRPPPTWRKRRLRW